MAIFPLAPDQTIAQMWSNGVQGATSAFIAMEFTSWVHVYLTVKLLKKKPSRLVFGH